MADENNALLAPVGPAWAQVRLKSPDTELYIDPTHPNFNGTYLAACVFLAVLLQESPIGLPHKEEIDQQTLDILQKTADETTKAFSL